MISFVRDFCPHPPPSFPHPRFPTNTQKEKKFTVDTEHLPLALKLQFLHFGKPRSFFLARKGCRNTHQVYYSVVYMGIPLAHPIFRGGRQKGGRWLSYAGNVVRSAEGGRTTWDKGEGTPPTVAVHTTACLAGARTAHMKYAIFMCSRTRSAKYGELFLLGFSYLAPLVLGRNMKLDIGMDVCCR